MQTVDIAISPLLRNVDIFLFSFASKLTKKYELPKIVVTALGSIFFALHSKEEMSARKIVWLASGFCAALSLTLRHFHFARPASHSFLIFLDQLHLNHNVVPNGAGIWAYLVCFLHHGLSYIIVNTG